MIARPDGFVGIVMALQGIDDAAVVLHGQNGCRKGLLLGDRLNPRTRHGRAYGSPYYAGATSLPYSCVTQADYSGGSYPKLEAVLAHVAEEDYGLVGVVPAPGVALIGDDIGRAVSGAGLGDRALVIEAGLSPEPLWRGYDRAASEVVFRMCQKVEKRRPGTANIIGLSITQKDWSTVAEELRHVLSLMGIETVCTLCAGCTTEEVERSSGAEVNVAVCPEYCEATARVYEDRFGIGTVSAGEAPVGFGACERLVRAVAERTGRDPSPALAYISGLKRRAYRGMVARGRDLRGATFSVDADPSVAAPLVRALYEDLAMVPASVVTTGDGLSKGELALSSWLTERGFGAAFGRAPPARVDFSFAGCDAAAAMEARGACAKGIGIGFPESSRVNLDRTPVIGPTGCLHLLDRILNP